MQRSHYRQIKALAAALAMHVRQVLASLANAYRLRSEFSYALSAAREAVYIAESRHARAAECLAGAVLAKSLLASAGGKGSAEAENEISRADALMVEGGVIIYAALMHRAKAKLAGNSEARHESLPLVRSK